LSDDELEKVQDAGATWDDGKSGVWKAEINSKTYYVSNTHRLYRTSKTLDGIIDEFHNNVKETS
jgi:hypothetical protein